MTVWFAVAASIIAVTAGIIWLVPSNKNGQTATIKATATINTKHDTSDIVKTPVSQQPDAGALFKQFFTVDKLPEQGQRPELLASAFDDYDNGNYKKIRQLDLANLPVLPDTRDVSVDTVNESRNVQQLGHYYKAVAFLQNSNIAGAKTNLLWVLAHAPSNALKVKAQWYLALTYLHDDISKNKVLPMLKNVAASRSKPFNQKASELLGKLGEEGSVYLDGKTETLKK